VTLLNPRTHAVTMAASGESNLETTWMRMEIDENGNKFSSFKYNKS